MRKRPDDHVVLDYGPDWVVRCLRCGAEYRAKLTPPRSADELLAMSRAFAKFHGKCRESDKRNGDERLTPL